MRRSVNEKFPTSTHKKNVDDVTSPFEGTWRKPRQMDVANRPRITWTSTIILLCLSFPPPSFSNIRIISKRLYFYHKNGRTPSPRMITRLQRYTKSPEPPNNSGDFCDNIYINCLITLHGLPAAKQSEGMSWVTTLPAPITVRSPMVTPGRQQLQQSHWNHLKNTVQSKKGLFQYNTIATV